MLLLPELMYRRAFEAEPGLSHARNTVVKHVEGEYIVWTDDALVGEGWLAVYTRV